jgi:quinohemoprotein ethanol dehydrogenase
MRILTFKLGGIATLPETPAPEIVTVPEVSADEETLAEGASQYDTVCRTCHGFDVVSGGMIPDLRYMSAQTHLEFDAIVLGGSRAEQGMASFADLLAPEDTDAIYAYIVSKAAKMRSNEKR